MKRLAAVALLPDRLRRLIGLATVLLLAATPAAGAPPQPPPELGDPTTAASGDFNGDGFDDLAVGVPWEDVGGKKDAGAVNVLYGSAAGLTATGDQFWHQGTAGVPGEPEKNDRFGRALAAGDFNGDGRDDLAIGAPYENIYVTKRDSLTGRECCGEDEVDAGYVVVLYGTPAGLSAAKSQGWHQKKDGVQGKPEDWDFFGWALAAGDFNGDDKDDLAVGAPGEGPDVTPERVKYFSGAVQILYGRASGLTASGDQIWQQGLGGVEEGREADDWFGGALAAGNLGYSTKEDDLAIGAPGEDFGSRIDAGAVHVLFGQPAKGLSTTQVPDLLLHENSQGVEDDAEGQDRFGWALAIADFGVTAQQDLAVGVPGESVGFSRQGAVHVFYGASFGPSGADDQIWHEGTDGVEGDPEAGDQFGRSLAVADFDAFSQADLAIGSPLEDVGSAPDAGAVHVIHGGPSGLTVTGSVAIADQLWIRPGGGATSDSYGFALAAGAFGNGPGADLGVTAPGISQADNGSVGMAHVLYGSDPTGLSTSRAQQWHQDSPGIEDQSEAGDRFGG